MTDENVQAHAGDGEDDHIDRRAQRQAHHIEREWQRTERAAAATISGTCSLRIGIYSNFSMRSPSKPRGRSSRTSAIRRYIEASPHDGLK